MADKPVKDYDKFMLRFPDGMREAVAERAKVNGRSMNSEIIHIIEGSLNGINHSDDNFDQMYDYVTTEYPCDSEEWVARDRALTLLVNEITNRLEVETLRLKALFNIRSPDGTYKQNDLK